MLKKINADVATPSRSYRLTSISVRILPVLKNNYPVFIAVKIDKKMRHL